MSGPNFMAVDPNAIETVTENHKSQPHSGAREKSGHHLHRLDSFTGNGFNLCTKFYLNLS